MHYGSDEEFSKSIVVCEATEAILDDTIEKLTKAETDNIIIEVIRTLRNQTGTLLNLNLPVRE